MTRIASTSLWQEPSAVAVAATAQRVYLIENADGSLSLTLNPAEATHWLVETSGGFVTVQPYPGSTTRLVLLASEFVVPLVLEAADLDRLYHEHYMAEDGSGNTELNATRPGDRFLTDDGSGNWELSNTDSGDTFLALTTDDPAGDGVHILPRGA